MCVLLENSRFRQTKTDTVAGVQKTYPAVSWISLRELQHTPGAYPRHPETLKRKQFLHKLLVQGLGYVPGAC